MSKTMFSANCFEKQKNALRVYYVFLSERLQKQQL